MGCVYHQRWMLAAESDSEEDSLLESSGLARNFTNLEY